MNEVASAIQSAVGVFVRQLRLLTVPGELSMPEYAVLARLSRGGPATTTTLANQEQITTQSIGATISSLEKRGLVERRPDTDDGRQSILSVTSAGSRELRHRRDTRTVQLSKALSSGFTASEMTELQSAAILLERLAYLL